MPSGVGGRILPGHELYADHEGGQEAMSRFAVVRAGEDRWWVSMARHRAVTLP